MMDYGQLWSDKLTWTFSSGELKIKMWKKGKFIFFYLHTRISLWMSWDLSSITAEKIWGCTSRFDLSQEKEPMLWQMMVENSVVFVNKYMNYAFSNQIWQYLHAQLSFPGMEETVPIFTKVRRNSLRCRSYNWPNNKVTNL